MVWWEWVLSALLFIVSLGALITIHEAGHLSMAKTFGVYCHEFSIGFGPKILKKKKEGHETYFSIRAIPLGGYVSMYGEENTDLEEFKNLPPERSLEGVKKWKKAIIVSAGVILNAILAFILIFISNVAFPKRTPTRSVTVDENSIAQVVGISNDDGMEFIYPSYKCQDDRITAFQYDYTTSDKVIHMGNFYIVDTDITIENEYSEVENFVLTFYFTNNKGNSSFVSGMTLYHAISSEDLATNAEVNKVFGDWEKEANHPMYYPDFTRNPYIPKEGRKFNADLLFVTDDSGVLATKTIEFAAVKDGNNYKWQDIGLYFQIKDIWLPFGESLKNTFIDYGDAAVAVFKGLGVLFTGGIKNMSGIVGIFETSASLLSNYTFATYLYFWGMISVNLAIFNLLPFPGLDGWQLLVTAIEGISHKKIPNKVKSIVSFIGLGLLFALMIVIVVIDVLRIMGI